MKNRGSTLLFRWLSIILILAAVILTVVQLVRYSRIRSNFPTGLTVAGIPVGGLDTSAASDRLLQAYTAVPVEVRYRDAVIQIKPAVVGFKLDIEAMLAAADLERVRQPFWTGFWDFLWNRFDRPKAIPLISSLSEDRLRAFLKDEIAARYDQPPSASMPVPGTTTFQSGQPGSELDIPRAAVLIADAFKSPNARTVNLTFNRIESARPSIDNLKILLEQLVQLSKYDGTIELYVNDLQSGEEIHFAYHQGQLVAPDIAFTAASTMKIPIMVSTFRRSAEPLAQDVAEKIALMIDYSENGPADTLMQTVMDRNTGPLQVTEDMRTLGLENTFLAGYFFPGAPLLQRYQTPANQRTDVNTDSDPYNQTTPTEMGMLLEDIYRCSINGGGTFAAVFPGELTQAECKQMIAYLEKNTNAVLLEAGLPEATPIAHKHGWIIETDGLMHSVSDAGIVFTPGGNYVITVYLHQTTQLLWESANLLVGQVSQAVYNYFNLPK